MSEPACPACDLEIAAPERGDEANIRAGVECPGCSRPLTWFTDGAAGGRWIRDEEAEGRIRMEQGPDA